MSVSLKSATRGVTTLAVASGVLLSGIALAGAAHAAPSAPTYEPDPNAVGTVSLYDANGAPLTSGSITAHPFATYLAGSGGYTPGSGAPKTAQAYAATPVDGTNSQTWSSDTLSGGTAFGTAASANYPGALKNSPNAIAMSTPADFSLQDYMSEFPAGSTLNPNVFQIRVYTGNPTNFYAMDVKVDPVAGTWTQVYPKVVVPTAVSTPVASPANPTTGQSTTLSATVTAGDGSHPAGTVALQDNGTTVQSATFNAATGAVSTTVTAAKGQHSYSFVFTPTDATSYGSSSSAPLVLTVNDPVAQNTTTVVSGPTTGTVGDAVTYTASVAVAGASAVPNGAGTVQFSVDGAPVGTPVAVTNGTASFTYTLADTSSHTIKAAFTHTAGQLYNDSADTTGVTVTATAAAYAPDPQSAVVNVPAGTLVISTPWTNAHPFILGNLVLDPNGNGYSASGSFGNTSATAGNLAADPTSSNSQLAPGAKPADVDAAVAAQNAALGNGITITDTRANSQGWTASAQTTDFTNPTLNTPINGDNLTFHDLKVKYVPGNAIQSGVQVNTIAAFKSAKQSFAKFSTPNTPGTVAIAGTLTLTAPTSTKAGQYTATITFTIV